MASVMAFNCCGLAPVTLRVTETFGIAVPELLVTSALNVMG